MPRWLHRILIVVVVAALATMFVLWLLEFYPRRVPHPALILPQAMLALEHARILVSPTAAPIEDGTILIHDGIIAAVGPTVDIPQAATRVDLHGATVTAGFWNAHVHLTQPRWSGAEWKPAGELDAGLADMFLARGFTTVVDLGSNPADTLALRRRIERGELAGPHIYSALGALYPPHGVPYYLKETLPGWLIAIMPQPESPEKAARLVEDNLKTGADLTKIFTSSWVRRGEIVPMPPAIAQACVQASHRQGAPVFAHNSDLEGTRIAMDAGVDVLAHAVSRSEGVDAKVMAEVAHRGMGLTPTLKMFETTVSTDPHYLDPLYEQVREFHAAGGQLLFGTDVGYMTDYSTEGEFTALGKSGLEWRDVLAMLTTNPAARFGVSAQKGTVEAGKLADLAVLDADPAGALTNFSSVRMTIRSGKIVWQR